MPRRRHTLPLLAAALMGMAATALPQAASAQSANSGALTLQVDRSQRIALRGAADSVIVGNPLIADVTVVDANTLFVTGKGYGVTEIVAVDAIGRTLFQNQVIVTGGQTGSVRVWRGATATEMACASSCSPSVRLSGIEAAGAGAPTP
ncbi:pilus assembly protein N-terminal domain-containing protein [Brevundimonas sp.]|uniref:pilus assembly protein N-terminal domain-containing protein n=1 Tax=Brevundimonas sp. TaxID=1871086 RepID=UPI003BA8DAEA